MLEWIPGIERQTWGKDGGSFTGGPAKLVIHTTETRHWPSYRSGATAPHATVLATPMDKKLHFRQHIPLDRAARALVNESGGVQTNRDSAVQIELIGTCDPAYARRYPDAFKWYDPPDWAIQGLVSVFKLICEEKGIGYNAPSRWLSYPDSYGNRNGQRMTNKQWDNFNGICGHEHVDENLHGDPGSFPIAKLLNYLKGSDEDMPTAQEVALATLNQGITKRGNYGDTDSVTSLRQNVAWSDNNLGSIQRTQVLILAMLEAIVAKTNALSQEDVDKIRAAVEAEVKESFAEGFEFDVTVTPKPSE